MPKVQKHLYGWRLIATLLLVSLVACTPGTKISTRVIPSQTGIRTPSRQTTMTSGWREETPSSTLQATVTQSIQINLDPARIQGLKITLAHPWQEIISRRFQALVNEFNQNNEWGIQVTLQSYPGMEELFEVIQSVESIPNVVIMSPSLAKQMEEIVVWTDLTPYIYDPVWGMPPALQSDLAQTAIASVSSSSGLIGFPAVLDAEVLFYNLTWASELGFAEPPGTISELREQACAGYQERLADGNIENDGTGGLLLNINPGSALSWYEAFSAHGLPNTGGLQLDPAGAEQAFGYVKSLFDEGCAWIGRLDQPFGYFTERNALLFSGKVTDALPLIESLSHANSKDQWVALAYPRVVNESSLLVSSTAYMVTGASPEVQLASWLFIRWMSSPAVTQSLSQVTGSMSFYPARDAQNLIALAGLGLFYQPIRAKWQVESMVIQDAYMRVLTLEVASLPLVVETLNATLDEIGSMEFED